MTGAASLHAVTGAPGTPLAALLGAGLEAIATYPPLIGASRRVIGRVSGPQGLLEEAGGDLPPGAAHPEATAVRLRRAGVELRWGAPDVIESTRELTAWCRDRGASSVHLARTDPSLVTQMQLGAWFHAGWRGRLLRRLTRGAPPGAAALHPRPLGLKLACDAAFWGGVRSEASAAEWRRLTSSSYVMLVYHRLAGEGKPGQERIDVHPRLFAAQLRALRMLRFHHLPSGEILAFHLGERESLPRRSFAVTIDDGFLDCREPLLEQRSLQPQLFVCTRELGGEAHWADREPVMDWEQVAELADAAVAVGAHGRRHEVLVGLADTALRLSLEGSLADLRERIAKPLAVLAYPHGAHDGRVCRAARQAGFRAAYTTEKGKNGAGTDMFCLRRISVHASDGPVTVLWKALTGEPAPRLRRPARGLRARVAGIRS